MTQEQTCSGKENAAEPIFSAAFDFLEGIIRLPEASLPELPDVPSGYR